MSPSAVESVPQVVDEIKAKILPVQVKEVAPPAEEPTESLEVKSIDTPASTKSANCSNGTAPAPEGALPERLENHKEPLKLSGALDQFSSFDVTPVIGREFEGVDLVKWLRAPNSDELLRDLAITSRFLSPYPKNLSPPNRH